MRLYKYVHPDRIDILVNANIRFTQPPALNDPFEMRPVIAGAFEKDFVSGIFATEEYKINAERNFIEEIRKHPLYADASEEDLVKYFNAVLPLLKPLGQNFFDTVGGQFAKIFAEALPDQFINQLGVLCLSETPDNDLMWSHYADSHRGFVIEFDSTHSFFDQRKTDSDDLRQLQKVIYSENRPTITVMNLAASAIFLTKDVKWSYEQEWRMVVPLSDADKHFSVAPHDVYLFNIPRGAITGIVLGSNSSKELEESILKALDSSPEYRNVRVRKAVLSDQDYGIADEQYVLRYDPEALQRLLVDLFPAHGRLSLEGYKNLVIDLNVMNLHSLHAVESFLARYAPMILGDNWSRNSVPVDSETAGQSYDSRGTGHVLQRSHADIVREALRLDFGQEWDEYTKMRDARNRTIKSDMPDEPLQDVLKSLPINEIGEISKSMLPKILGLTPEELEELEKN
jgi:hypothetical protein